MNEAPATGEGSGLEGEKYAKILSQNQKKKVRPFLQYEEDFIMDATLVERCSTPHPTNMKKRPGLVLSLSDSCYLILVMATGAVLPPWAFAVVLSNSAFQPPDAQLCL